MAVFGVTAANASYTGPRCYDSVAIGTGTTQTATYRGNRGYSRVLAASCPTGTTKQNASPTSGSIPAASSNTGSASCGIICLGNTVTITLNKNGGTGNVMGGMHGTETTGGTNATGTTSATHTCYRGVPCTLPTPNNLTRTGYKVISSKWHTNTSNGGTVYASATSLADGSFPTASTMLYAGWTEDTVAVTLNKNKGSGDTPATTHCDKSSGEEDIVCKCPKDLPCILPPSSSLVNVNPISTTPGWGNKPDSLTILYTTSGTFSTTTTLYAVWTKCNECATSNASCRLSVSSNACSYSTSCNTGHTGGTPNTYNHSCTPCANGSFKSTTGSAACTLCNTLTGASPAGGTYTTNPASAATANTACRYQAPAKAITGCHTVTSNLMSYSGSSWPASTYAVTAKQGNVIASNNTSSATCTCCDTGLFMASADGHTNTSCTNCNTVPTTQTAPHSTVSGGTYTTSPATCATANTTCRYTAPAKTIAGCTAVTANLLSNATGSWTWNFYSVTANSGYVIANNGASNATCTQCNGAVYMGAANGHTNTSCWTCPTATSNWTRNTGSGWTNCNQCNQTQIPDGCCTAVDSSIGCTAVSAEAKRIGNSSTTSTCSWNTTSDTASGTMRAKAGRYVSGALCPECTGITYSEGGTVTSCTNCTTTNSNYGFDPVGYVRDRTKSSSCLRDVGSGRRVASGNAEGPMPAGSGAGSISSAGVITGAMFSKRHAVGFGTTSAQGILINADNSLNPTGKSWDGSCTGPVCSCGPNSEDYGNVGASGTGPESCYAICPAGKRVSTAQAACAAIPAGTGTSANWSNQHNVYWGNTSATCTTAGCTNTGVNRCPTNYQNTNASASAQTSCFTKCSAGYRVASVNGACVCVGADSYKAAHDVNYNNTSVGTACAAGTKSSGCGTGAAASTDCKAFKTLKTSKGQSIILRAIKDTSAAKSLAVNVGGTVYYGNLLTTGSGGVKLNIGGTVYYLTNNQSSSL